MDPLGFRASPLTGGHGLCWVPFSIQGLGVNTCLGASVTTESALRSRLALLGDTRVLAAVALKTVSKHVCSPGCMAINEQKTAIG